MNVIDPGHGGRELAGRSTPFGCCGPNGTIEKDVTLDVAKRVRALGNSSVVLTRDADVNRSIAERIHVARTHHADAFVSLHANSSTDPNERGIELYTHEHARSESRALADEMMSALISVGQRVRGVFQGPLAVLDPARHAPHTKAVLVELGYLSDPYEERRFGDPEHRERIARAIAGAIEGNGRLTVRARRESFDVWHEVPLVQQLTGMSCWAAAAAMVVGWRDCIAVNAEEVAHATGRWESYRDGLEPKDVETLARTFDLIAEPPRKYTLEEMRRLLERFGPLWVGEASPGLHVITIAGMYGDGTPEGTFMRIADPWPIGRGERYTISWRELADRLDAVHTLAGIGAQVIHSGGRACGSRGRFFSRRESRLVLDGQTVSPEVAHDILTPFIH